MGRLHLSRDQLASFLKDFEQIKQFEQFLGDANDNIETTDISLQLAGAALTAANEANAAIQRIQDMLDRAPAHQGNAELYALRDAVLSAPQPLAPSTLAAGDGLTGGGNMGADVTLSMVHPNGYALFDHYATAGNSGTSETDLYTDTIAASQLGANGDKLEAEYAGSFVSSATATRQIKLYFGGTAIFDTGTLTLSLSSAWTMYVMLIRVSATTVRYMISLTTEGAALAAYTAAGELAGLDLTATNILKITGQAGGVGAASNDIVSLLGSVVYVPAA